MNSSMRRLYALAVVALALPLGVLAQPAVDARRLGFLGVFRIGDTEQGADGCPVKGTVYWQAFVEGLRERGVVPGRNLVMACRTTEGREDRASALAEELVRLTPDLLVVFSSPNARAAKQATSTIPIVFVGVVDPAGRGIVANLARPGGNVTGLADDAGTQTAGKYLELAKELVPRATRVAVLAYQLPTSETIFMTDVAAAASALGLALSVHRLREPAGLEGAFDAMARSGAEALVVIPHPFMAMHGKRIVELAARAKLPGVYPFREHAQAGGPVAYDVNRVAMWRRVGDYVDRILKGAKPADLPVEQPTEFDLIVNLSAARALGIAIPQSLQVRANEVIP